MQTVEALIGSAVAMCVFGAALLPLNAQQRQQSAQDLLHHALYLADLYNWTDAGPEFSQAEKKFAAEGDQRNALYARLGRLRSTVEHSPLPAISAQLGTELDTNPLLRNDKQLRLFCFIVKGDINQELNSGAMRHDWEQVQALARELGNTKWQYRALAQLGLAAYYEGDLATARKNVDSALAAATAAGDAGAQIRLLTDLGTGLVFTKLYDQALPYFDKALQIAGATPDSGYPYPTNEQRLNAMIGLKQFDQAHALAADILKHARDQHRPFHQVQVLVQMSQIATAQGDFPTALALLERSLPLSQEAGSARQKGAVQILLADAYLERGDLPRAAHFADLASGSAQASGDISSVPEVLQTLAGIEIKQGAYAEADRAYDRAVAFVDSAIGNLSGVLDKTALIKSSSELYVEHFSLIAQHFNNPAKAFSIIEQVRGRITTDLLMAGSVTPEQARKEERTISQLQLKLMAARSDAEVSRIRDQIFMAEQSRWVTPDVSILKSRAHVLARLGRVERSLSPSVVVLEYVVADPQSYCLVITSGGSHIVPLASRERINALVTTYLESVKAKRPAREEGRQLYELLLRPIAEATQKETLVIVPDGPLHLVPFEGLSMNLGSTLSRRAPSSTSRRQPAFTYSHRIGAAHALLLTPSWQWAVFLTILLN